MLSNEWNNYCFSLFFPKDRHAQKSEQLVHSGMCLSFEQTKKTKGTKKETEFTKKEREKSRLQCAENKCILFYSA